MKLSEMGATWPELSRQAWEDVKAWRAVHPTATLTEIETAVDETLARLRAQMVEDAALASAATEAGHLPEGERPHCPECGAALAWQAKRTRRVTTRHEQTLELARSYGHCPRCHSGLFPPG